MDALQITALSHYSTVSERTIRRLLGGARITIRSQRRIIMALPMLRSKALVAEVAAVIEMAERKV